MKILVLTHYYWPHIGGVEKHSGAVAQELAKKGHDLTLITERYDEKLKAKEIKNGIKIIRFTYPYIKILGLLSIWLWFWKNRNLIKQSDIIHCHDVFIWYLPFRFLYLNKPVFTTFHGWEGIWPIPKKYILLKKVANKFSRGTIVVGKYIEKYYGIKTDFITYGGVKLAKYSGMKSRKIIYLGRLERDTGVIEFLHWFRSLVHGYEVDFCGDGNLRKECERYGTVHGFCDPVGFLRKAAICVPGGYLSYLEAKAFGCKIKVFWDNPLKKDYWHEILKIKKIPTWEEVADEYLDLYNRFK